MSEKILAESSFDLPTSGLWAQHAPTAPLCLPEDRCLKLTSVLRVAPQKTNYVQRVEASDGCLNSL